jgi:hypothetical protein
MRPTLAHCRVLKARTDTDLAYIRRLIASSVILLEISSVILGELFAYLAHIHIMIATTAIVTDEYW